MRSRRGGKRFARGARGIALRMGVARCAGAGGIGRWRGVPRNVRSGSGEVFQIWKVSIDHFPTVDSRPSVAMSNARLVAFDESGNLMRVRNRLGTDLTPDEPLTTPELTAI